MEDETALHARLHALEQENARLLEEQWTRLQETRALTGIGRLLSERLDPDVVGGRIAESLRSLLGGGSAVVYRLDDDSANLLAMAVAHDPSAPTVGWRPVREIGSGAVGLAMRERRTVTSADVLADTRMDIPAPLRAHMDAGPDRAILAVPLLTQDRLIGVLAVRTATGTVFDARAVQLAEALADQAAITLEHARLFAEEERRRREAEVLADLARTIGAAPELATVLRRVTEAAQELCRSDGAVIGLRIPDSDAVLLRYWTSTWYTTLARDPGRARQGARRPRARGAPARLRTSDYLHDTRISSRYRSRSPRSGSTAKMAVPILIDDRVEGLLYVDNRSARTFTDQHESVLVRLAAQAAIAIRNAQILEAEQIARGTAERLVRALRESQDRFQFVARATNDAVWDWDLVSDALWWNEGVNTLFGYTPEQVGPDVTWWYETIHPDDRDRVKRDIQRGGGARGRELERGVSLPPGRRDVRLRLRPGLRAARRGRPGHAHDRRDDGHHPAPRARGTAPAGPEDGGGGPPRGRRRARLQQPAHDHHRPHPPGPRPAQGRRPGAPQRGGDPEDGGPRRRRSRGSSWPSAASRCSSARSSTSTPWSRTRARCCGGSSARTWSCC